MTLLMSRDVGDPYGDGYKNGFTSYSLALVNERNLMLVVAAWKTKADCSVNDVDNFDYSCGFVDSVIDVIRKRRNGGFNAPNDLS